MYRKFFTLFFLIAFLVSCSDSKSVSDDKEEGESQAEEQNRDTDSTSENDAADQKEDQTEELYTITMRGGNWPIMNDGNTRDLYFVNMGGEVDVRKHFDRNALIEANWCVVLRKSDFPHLSIRWQFNDKMIECNNSYASTLKCSESVANLFLDLPNNAIGMVTFPLKTTGERNPEMEKCYKLY